MGKISKTYHFDTKTIAGDVSNDINSDISSDNILDINMLSLQPDGTYSRVTPSQVYLESDPLKDNNGSVQQFLDTYIKDQIVNYDSILLSKTNPYNDDAIKDSSTSHVIKKRDLVDIETDNNNINKNKKSNDINIDSMSSANTNAFVGRLVMDSIVASGVIYAMGYERGGWNSVKEGVAVALGVGISEQLGVRTWKLIDVNKTTAGS